MSTTQDYQAAEQLLRRPARPGELVIGDKVRPQWIDGGARFWYAVSNGAGRRFVLVDPAAGTREPAFDHARLAAALAAASGQQVDPEALPFMAIEPAGNAVEFDALGEHWRCRLDSYACERAEFTPPGNPLEVPSPDKKVAVSQRGHDLWARSLSDGREWALTADGEPDYRYGSGPDCTSNGTLLRKFGLPHLPPAVAWSPDSTKVLAHRTDERGVRQTYLVEARPADGGAPLLRTQRYAYPGDEHVPHAELVVLDVQGGSMVRAQAEPLLMPQSSPIMIKWTWWAPDGSAVYYLSQPRDLRTLTLHRLEPATGAVTTVVSETAATRVEPNQCMTEPPIVRVLVELERADITKLTATGWTPPGRFRVKAADGVTDIYGVLYRPRGFDPRAALPGGGQRLPRPAGHPGRPVLRPRRDGPRRGTHRGAGLRGGRGGWARHPRAEQVLPRRLLRPFGRRGLPGRPCRGAAAAGPDPAVDGPGPDGRVRPLRRRVRHSAGDAELP
jgi:dipeptidyl aminopeptidase/acylaminoacyl peptidase